MRRIVTLLTTSLILGGAPADSVAQDSACTYDRCALGV
jgi:hypothetical protein